MKKTNYLLSIFLSSIFTLILFFEAAEAATVLQTAEKNISVNGKTATVLALSQPDGTLGISAKKGEFFDLILKNRMQIPTSIHWHGLILPNNQDGVAFVTQFALYPGLDYHYKFPLMQSGTYWMHSHLGLQEQKLLSAPLIIYDPEDSKIADQEAILFFADFSFKSPSEIYRQLRCKHKETPLKKEMSSQDIVEVDYDAFLINYRTLENPDIVKVEPGKKVRLRIINGASATNCFIVLGNLEGEAIAVDGNRIQPLRSAQFELAVAQRIDILLKIPEEGGVFPILARGEGTDKQAGILLTTQENGPLPNLSEKSTEKAGALTNAQERNLHALYPLAKKPVDRKLVIELGGNMADYSWTMNGQSWPEVTPLVVAQGERVEINFKNSTTMSHPMHLHGHVFQVTAIDGKPFDGAMRDTILVMPNSTVSIQFDADNPGVWPLHCHILYHLEAGMFTVLRYKDFIQPL
jgi:FtsP/CotA-like multicopper oxidase with cupredoxin domain